MRVQDILTEMVWNSFYLLVHNTIKRKCNLALAERDGLISLFKAFQRVTKVANLVDVTALIGVLLAKNTVT